MIVSVFVFSLALSVATYLLLSKHFDRKQRGAAVRRLHGKVAAPKDPQHHLSLIHISEPTRP